jgi:TatA/E family protein of Tat protein translocase
MVLLFLESLGTTELLVILVVALVLFGPRKLPEMTRKFGKSLNEFKRASDDFKRTWEREVAMESVEREAAVDRAMVSEPQAASFATEASNGGTGEATARDITEAAVAPVQGANIARGAYVETPAHVAAVNDDEAETGAEQQPARKTDWL